jgi:hypothetical protein
MYQQLRYLGERYEIVSPISVEVTVSADSDGILYCMCIANLQNELIFGMGRTKRQARRMLRKLLIGYYEKLMSVDLNQYRGSEKYIYSLDKDFLEGSIKKHESAT